MTNKERRVSLAFRARHRAVFFLIELFCLLLAKEAFFSFFQKGGEEKNRGWELGRRRSRRRVVLGSCFVVIVGPRRPRFLGRIFLLFLSFSLARIGFRGPLFLVTLRPSRKKQHAANNSLGIVF